MSICTFEELGRASATLTKFNVHHHRDALPMPRHGLPALGKLKLELQSRMRTLLEQQGPMARSHHEYEELARIAHEADLFGLRMVDVERNGLTNDLKRLAGMSEPLIYESRLQGLFARRLDVRQVALDLHEKAAGFSPIDTPCVSEVTDALQQSDRKQSSRVVALNAGGTEAQLAMGDVTADNVHVSSIAARTMEKGRCETWGDFWHLHFTGEQLQMLRTLPPETTISVGLAFPQRTERTKDGRTDAYVEHFADKYDASAIGPRNASEMPQWQGREQVTLGQSLHAFLLRQTGVDFTRITITPNDTITGAVAFAGSPSAAGKKIGCMVCGTGFNISVAGTNLEAGHYANNSQVFTPFDRVALAQRGGGALDIENAACGKILSDVFLNIARTSCDESTVGQLESLSRKERDILCFRLAYGDTETLHAKGWSRFATPVLCSIARTLVGRTEHTVATLAAAARMVYGVEAIYGEGSYVRKERQFVQGVNASVRQQSPEQQEDLLLIERIPMTFADDDSAKYETASLAGTFMYAHGENLLEQQRRAA